MARDTTRKGKVGARRGKAPVESTLPDFTAAELRALLMSVARLSEDPGDVALDLAQEKAFEAMEAPTAGKRIALARAALALSPHCADAYLVLARETRDADEALDLYRQAVVAGAEAVEETVSEDDVGSFWGLIQTRPYMRARHELAMALWEGGDCDEAIEHYQDMLRLNPNDNQGIRYLLLDALVVLGRDTEAAARLKSYKDERSAAWTWSGALLKFRRAPGGAAARKALIEAFDANRHVPAYLLGDKPLPRTLPDFIGMGDENEAVAYVHDSADAWTAAPGAKAWVAEVLKIRIGENGRRQEKAPVSDTDLDRIDEAILGLLVLGLHDERRAWKTFDWDALDRLHAKGLIANPASRAKSVALTDSGLNEAMRLHRALFTKTPPNPS